MIQKREYIENLLDDAKKISENYKVSLLTNTRNKTRVINGQPIHYTNNNEFFSDTEYSEILSGIQEAGFYTNSYFNELEFIHKTLGESYYQNNQIVYNLARNGDFVGKKSLIPSFCDLMSIPYTGSNAWVISLCRAKYTYSKYLESHGIRIPESWIYSSNETWLDHHSPSPGQKIIMKPMYESASIGLTEKSTFIYNPQTFKDNLKKAGIVVDPFKDTKWLVQEFISGDECEVPILMGKEPIDLAVVGISVNGDQSMQDKILTSDISDNSGYTFHDLNTKLKAEKVHHISLAARKIAILIELRHYGRIDFRIDSQGQAYLIDIASSPYTTEHSSFDYAFKKMGFKNSDIYASIIAMAYKDIKKS